MIAGRSDSLWLSYNLAILQSHTQEDTSLRIWFILEHEPFGHTTKETAKPGCVLLGIENDQPMLLIYLIWMQVGLLGCSAEG